MIASVRKKLPRVVRSWIGAHGVPACLLVAWLALSGSGCKESDSPVASAPVSGRTVTGRVLESPLDRPVAFARVGLHSTARIRFVLSDAAGNFIMTGVTQGSYRLVVERAGYDSLSVEVPQGVRDTSFVTARLIRSAAVPATKPVGRGMYRIANRQLEEDYNGDGVYSRLEVKGVAFSPAVIGSNTTTSAVIDRSMLFLDTLNANAIRTYSGADPHLLVRAAERGIGVIVSYWVETSYNLADPAAREAVLEGFARMVAGLRTYQSVMLWNLGNEQNYTNGNNPYWYDLVQELAITAFEIEGEYYHPVCASNGDIQTIGDPAKRSTDSLLSYMDLWGTNIYKMNLTSSLSTFRARSGKPLVITEFGIDALDNRTKLEYEGVQTLIDSTNWAQIRAAGDVCVGATVFEFTDEWWKAGDAARHDYGGYATGEHPDGYSNEEWWGLIAVTPDTNGDGFDEWRPRAAFRMFQRVWQ